LKLSGVLERRAFADAPRFTRDTSPLVGEAASPAMPLIALTGGTGFIGRYLLRQLSKRGYRLRVLLRRPSVLPAECASAVVGADAVIHSAGVSHEMSGLPEDDHRALNTEATIGLARAAQRAGVRRFVFLSSIDRKSTRLNSSHEWISYAVFC